MVFLAEQTASSSAQLDFTTGISATYESYVFIVLNLVPATNNVALYVRLSTDGGSTFDSGSNYSWANWRFNTGGSGVNSADNATVIDIAGEATISNTASDGGYVATFELSNPGSASHYKAVYGQNRMPGGTSGSVFHGVYKSTTAVNAVRFFMSSGNIASGTIRLYGIAKA